MSCQNPRSIIFCKKISKIQNISFNLLEPHFFPKKLSRGGMNGSRALYDNLHKIDYLILFCKAS